MYNGGLGFGLSGLTLGVTLSLVGNATLFFWVSILTQTHVAEHWQASRFIGRKSPHRPVHVACSPYGSRIC